MRLRASALILAACGILFGTLGTGCRKVENPMPTDLHRRSGFLVNYAIQNPEPPQPKLAPPLAKRFEGANLRVLVGHHFLSPGVRDSYVKKSGVDLEVAFFSDHLELQRRIIAGERFDLAISVGHMVQTLHRAGLLAELDYHNIPNVKFVAPQYRSLPFDPDNKISVALLWSSLGIAYNSKLLDQAPREWKDLFEPPAEMAAVLAGRTALLTSPQRIFGAALARLGHSINSENAAEHRDAAAYLRRIAAEHRIRLIDQDHISEHLAKGDVLLAMAHASDVARATLRNPNVAFAVPHEGSWITFDNVVVLHKTTARQKAIAEDFINFLLHPTVAAATANYNLKASTEPAATAFLNSAIKHGATYLRSAGTTAVLLDLVDSSLESQVYRELEAAQPPPPPAP